LKKVSERALQGTGICLRFTSTGLARPAGEAVEDNLLRICEEAVTNAVKHAHPSEVETNLEYTCDELRLCIRDNGCGFDPAGPAGAKSGHFGLVGMRERAKSVEGKLALKSKPGQGTEILVTVRLRNESMESLTSHMMVKDEAHQTFLP
jgi:signal transduction histidine kinase